MELYTIPVETDPAKTILFRPLIGLAFVGNHAMVKITRALLNGEENFSPSAHEAQAFLQQIGFLAPDPPAPQPLDTTFHPQLAVLLMTNQCQLRCTYCYAAAGEKSPLMLDLALGKTVIDFVSRNAQQAGSPSFEVSFHGGGEPTLAWDTLQSCARYARSQSVPARMTLTTNGVWSSQKRIWILDNLDGLTLSMDGSPQTQNRQRPFASGKESFKGVIQSVAEMDRRNFKYAIRLTALAPWKNLADDVRFLCQETGCKTFQVEPAFNSERGGHGQPDLEQALAFSDACLEAVDAAAQAGRKLFFSGARLGLTTASFCTAPYQAIIVNPASDMVTCYEVADDAHLLAGLSRIGHVRDGEIRLDEPARAHLLRLIAERRAACRDCFCYWSCAGNCYSRAFGKNGNEMGSHLSQGARCEINRSLTYGLLLRGIAEGGGVWRSNYHPACAALIKSPRLSKENEIPNQAC